MIFEKMSLEDEENNKSLDEEFILQINDISDKIFYNEKKAEIKFQTLMNASVSHELRNPLNSIVGQLISMKDIVSQFYAVLMILK